MTIRLSKSRPIDEFACDAEPGSLAKLEVLASRWVRGFALFHPCDRRIEENRIFCEPRMPRRFSSCDDFDVLPIDLDETD
jgi:hypothetical protein